MVGDGLGCGQQDMLDGVDIGCAGRVDCDQQDISLVVVELVASGGSIG